MPSGEDEAQPQWDRSAAGGGGEVEACGVSRAPWGAGADGGAPPPPPPLGHKACGREGGCRPGPEWPSLVPEAHGQGVGREWACGAPHRPGTAALRWAWSSPSEPRASWAAGCPGWLLAACAGGQVWEQRASAAATVPRPLARQEDHTHPWPRSPWCLAGSCHQADAAGPGPPAGALGAGQRSAAEQAAVRICWGLGAKRGGGAR